MTKLSRYEQETIINFNAGEEMATVYTRDLAGFWVMMTQRFS